MAVTFLDEPEVAEAPKASRKITFLDDAPSPAPAEKAPLLNNSYYPLTSSTGQPLGNYALRKADEDNLDVDVNVQPPNQKADQTPWYSPIHPYNPTAAPVIPPMEKATLRVPMVKDTTVADEAAKAQADAIRLKAEADEAQKDANASMEQAGDAGGFAGLALHKQAQTARNAARVAELRAHNLSGPNGKAFLQGEMVHRTFQDSPLGQKFQEWHPGEDVARGFAGVETGLNAAYQNLFGTEEGKQQAQEAVGAIPEAFPGTSKTGLLGEGVRGAGELAGSLPLLINPAGVAVLGASTYGGTVAGAQLGANAAEAQAKELEGSNPELAKQFQDLATNMRRDAELHGALSAATMVGAGRLLPQAKSFLGTTARSSAEWGGINAAQDELNQKFSGNAPNPLTILEGLVTGAAMGAGHGLMSGGKPIIPDPVLEQKAAVIHEAKQNPDTALAAQAAEAKLQENLQKAPVESEAPAAEEPTVSAAPEVAPPVEAPAPETVLPTKVVPESQISPTEDTTIPVTPEPQLETLPNEPETRPTAEQPIIPPVQPKESTGAGPTGTTETAPEQQPATPESREEQTAGEKSIDPQKEVRLAHADVDAAREARGELPLEKVPQGTKDLWNERATQRVAAGEAPALLDSLTDNPRSIDAVEHFMLLNYSEHLRREKEKVETKLADPAITDAKREALGREKDLLEKENIKLEVASALGGSKLGANLGARRFSLNREGVPTFEQVVTDFMKIKDPTYKTPLTDKERAKLKELHADVEDKYRKAQDDEELAPLVKSLSKGRKKPLTREVVLKQLREALGIKRKEAAPVVPEEVPVVAPEAPVPVGEVMPKRRGRSGPVKKPAAEAPKAEEAPKPNTAHQQRLRESIEEVKSELQAARDAKGAGFGDEDTDAEIDSLSRQLAALKKRAAGEGLQFSIAEVEGSGEVSEAHQRTALQKLKQTKVGRTLLKGAIIVHDWQRAIAHPELAGRSFSSEELSRIKRSEGFFDPQTGKSVIIREGIRTRDGETPQEALMRVLRHERTGHQAVRWMVDNDPEFRKQYYKIAADIPEKELQDIAGPYAHLGKDSTQLVGEWFARQVEGLKEGEIPDSKTVFGRMWQAFKDFVSRTFGYSKRINQQVRDLARQVYSRPEAFEGREGLEGDVETSKQPPVIAPQQDADYLAAVEKGDLETVQRMVDEAAKAAGYEVGPVYHGSTHQFSEFKKSENSHPARRFFWFAGHEGKSGDENGNIFGAKWYGPNITKAYLKIDHPYPRGDVNEIHQEKIGPEFLKSHGYDGFIDTFTGSGFKAVVDPSQIKSADPITRDADGKVIPLSERFNPESNDIRFSLPEKPADEEPSRPRSIADLPHTVLDTLARFHIQEGAKDVYDLSTRMQETLKEFFPDATQSDVRRALVEYNKELNPTKDDLNKKLAQFKSEALLLEQVKEAKEGVIPKIRRLLEKPSQLSRELRKELSAVIKDKKLSRLSPEEQRATDLDRVKSRLNNTIEDLEKDIADLKDGLSISNRQRIPVERDDAVRELEARVTELRKERDTLEGSPELTAEQWNKRMVAATERATKELERRVKEKDVAAKAKPSFEASQELKEARAARDEAKEQLKQLSEYKLEEAERKINQAIRSRQRSREKVEEYIKNKNYAPKVRKAPLDDVRIKQADVELAKARRRLREEGDNWRLGQRTAFRKGMDRFVKFSREVKLLHPSTAEKLGGAGLENILTRPIGTAIAQTMRAVPVLRDIQKKATYEGRASLRSELKGLSGTFNSAKAVWQKATKGKSDIDWINDDKQHFSEEFKSYAGALHGAIKEPVRQGIFSRSLQLEIEAAREAGLEPEKNPLLLKELQARAYENANADIFMGDNFLTKAFRAGFASMRSNKQSPEMGKFVADVAEVLLPIINVPTNLFLRTSRLNPLIGLPEALVRIRKAAKRGDLANGAEKLSSKDADLITRAYKYGLFGTALAAYAWNNPQNFGGLSLSMRHPGGNDDKTLKAGEIKTPLGTINHFLAHGPVGTFLNVVADSRREYDDFLKKNPHENGEAAVAAAIWSMAAPVQRLPFVDTVLRTFSEFKSPEQHLAELTRGSFFPADTDIAQFLDRDTAGKPIKRKTATGLDELKLGIPGLRQTLPERKPRH